MSTMTEGTRLSLVTGRPCGVGAAEVYVMHVKATGLMIYVHVDKNEGYEAFLNFNSRAKLGVTCGG